MVLNNELPAVFPALLQSRLKIMQWMVRMNGQAAYLPDFLGSTLRGSFGHALKKISCGEGNCAYCASRAQCLYYTTFEELDFSEDGKDRGMVYRSRPYILRELSRQGGKKVHQLDFSLLLMGDYQNYIVHFIDTLQEMAKTGLGAQRTVFSLDSVYDLVSQKDFWQQGALCGFPQEGEVRDLANREAFASVFSQPSRVRLHFATPVRLVKKKIELKQFDLDFFWQQILGRYKYLHEAYGHFDPEDLDLCMPQLTASDMQFISWERYSNRQGGKHSQAGLAGTVELDGVGLKEWQFLQTMSLLHTGKNTSFGLGAMEVKALAA